MIATTAPRPGLLPLDGGPLDGGSLARTELVTPAMCGHNSLFAGQLGDWTWDAVSASCGVNAYDARNAAGDPTYLSFYYFRIRGSRRFHPLRMTFGDRLQVVSRVYGFGSESVLTLHRVRRDDGLPPRPIEAHEFYRYADEECLYVENFNRWITRTDPDSNRNLARSSPVGFHHAHLPALPDRYSPRRTYGHARSHAAFEPPAGFEPVGKPFVADYEVEPSRDLNGVGLLYFASYFSIVDWGTLRLWRHLGRTDRQFLTRAVIDRQLCYLGNADASTTVRVVSTVRRNPTQPHTDVIDTVLLDRESDTTLAVSAQTISSQPDREGDR
jgi:probable biosynthetic protein (TIGR04098 family)